MMRIGPAVRVCQRCGAQVITPTGNLRYCAECRAATEPERRREYAKRYYRKQRLLRRARIDATPGKVGGRCDFPGLGGANHAGASSDRSTGL